VPELYAAGEKITRRRTLFCVGAFGIVARNGKVLVKGMVWGDDIIIRNEFLVESANAIALTVAEVDKPFPCFYFVVWEVQQWLTQSSQHQSRPAAWLPPQKQVHGLSLASIWAALGRNPHEASKFRLAAAKLALIRGIKKIAGECRARERGQLTRNAYVKTLLAKFQEEEGPGPVNAFRNENALCAAF